MKARDKSPNRNETGFSSGVTVLSDNVDTASLLQGRMSFEILPYTASWNSVRMKAITIDNMGGVEYYFKKYPAVPAAATAAGKIARNIGIQD